jgi:hypothetical protein
MILLRTQTAGTRAAFSYSYMHASLRTALIVVGDGSWQTSKENLDVVPGN